jgi:Domain of unknown function (DUF5050)
MRQQLWTWWSCAALVALGCGGNAVDLGTRGSNGFADVAGESATPETPQTIYDGDDRVFGFGADDTKLYALLEEMGGAGRLVSCPIDRCKSELTLLASNVTLPNSSANDTKLESLGDWLYWTYGGGSPALGVAACPKTGCAEVVLVESSFRGELASDGQYVYWVDEDRALLRWQPGGAPERLAALPDGGGEALAVSADHVYFTNDRGTGVSRIRKDGSGAVTLIARADKISSLGVSGDAVYYASRTLAGALLRFALDGAGESTVVASNQRWPSGVRVSGADLFWIANAGFANLGSGREIGDLIGCRLPACQGPRAWHRGFLLSELGGGSQPSAVRGGFVITSSFVWWLEGKNGFGSALRRLPR